MNQRVERVAGEIRQVLGEALIRGEVKDPRVQAAGLITITYVRLTSDLREATVLFMAHGKTEEELTGIRAGLERAAGFLRHKLGRAMPLRFLPTLHFEVDRVFEQEAKIDAILAEVAQQRPKPQTSESPEVDPETPSTK